jgi:hypothetical protein
MAGRWTKVGMIQEKDTLRLIHTYHAVPMPFPCHAMPIRV